MEYVNVKRWCPECRKEYTLRYPKSEAKYISAEGLCERCWNIVEDAKQPIAYECTQREQVLQGW